MEDDWVKEELDKIMRTMAWKVGMGIPHGGVEGYIGIMKDEPEKKPEKEKKVKKKIGEVQTLPDSYYKKTEENK